MNPFTWLASLIRPKPPTPSVRFADNAWVGEDDLPVYSEELSTDGATEHYAKLLGLEFPEPTAMQEAPSWRNLPEPPWGDTSGFHVVRKLP